LGNERRVYTLNGLPPEVISVAFAKCSRSPEPFDVIAAELNADKSRQFHEKWVVGYGHSSVAEHAVLSLAVENVSILATKVIEDNRLASYTEKSTRYQVYDKTRYFKPKNLMQSDLGRLYEETVDFLMDKYQEFIPMMAAFLKKKYPKAPEIPGNLYEIQIKNKVLDNIRYVLPVSVLTNLGMTVNARQLEHAIVKLLSHPLEEMKEIGEDVKKAALSITPTLVKHTNPNNYFIETDKVLEGFAFEKTNDLKPDNKGGAFLVEWDSEAEDKLVAALLYRYSKHSYAQVKRLVNSLSVDDKERIIDESLSRREKFDAPLREFEHIFYTFDILMDYGAFRDIQRHRMCTQSNQDFTVENGYSITDEVIEAGLDKEYKLCMDKVVKAYKEIVKQFPKEAQYVIPLAFKKRTLFTMNLRELHHFIKLRSGKMGHISYRRIAQQMFDCIAEKHPLLAKYIMVDKS